MNPKTQLFMASILMLWAPAAAEEIAVQGVATTNCAQYEQMFRGDDPEYVETVFHSWGQGFMSGINLSRINQGVAPKDLGAISIDAMRDKLRRFCDAHPLLSYVDGVVEAYSELPTVDVAAFKEALSKQKTKSID